MRSSSLTFRLAVLLVAALVLVAFPAAVRSKNPKPVGTFTVTDDDVFVAKKHVTEDGKLYAGRSIRTAEDGVAQFHLKLKDTDCTLFQETRIIVRPAPKVALRVTTKKGEVWCVTGASATGSAMLEGPDGTRISVKDPVFGLVVRKSSTVVKVSRGAVVVNGRSGRSRAVVVSSGKQAVVPRRGDPLAPRAIVLTKTQKTATKRLTARLPPPKDTRPPVVRLLAVPPDQSETLSARFSFTADEKPGVTYTCAFDGGRFFVCVPPVTKTFRPGRHVFALRAVDAAGNVGKTVTHTWTIVKPASAAARIAFVSGRDGNPEIYDVNPDGTGQRRLTTSAADDEDPDWSPDRSRIVFHSDRDDRNPDVYVMSADGNGVTRLTSNPAIDRNPTWSPSGTRIAFESYRDKGNREIYVMNADGTGQTRLTTNLAQDLDPAWSPDGRRITFASVRDGNYEIYVMNADGTGQTRLTNTSVFEYGPVWSPDGGKIAFHSNRDGNYELYLMNPDGTDQARITTTASSEYNPSWSPDGTRIVFQTDRDGPSEIYVMSRDGSGQTNVTNDPGEDIVPDW